MHDAARLIAIAGIACALLAPAPARSDDLPVVPLSWNSAALDGMVRANAAYQRLLSAGGWPTVPDGPSMRPDMTDPRVPVLRQRLAATGDMSKSDAAATGDTVDPAVVAAVKRFQARHGLVVDGIAGRRTVAVMNVPVAERAAQLMVNDDRLRALARTLPATGIVVNIPAATAQLMIDGHVALTSRVIVGQPGWPTPLLESRIEGIVLNPYWNVPTRIARREILPKIATEPAYLAANHMRVLGGPNGAAEIPPSSVDWTQFFQRGYRLRQDPGPDNPLGQLKFMFPNKYDVYLHDTPSRRSFERSDRALSHGCIRIDRAFDLAVRLLADDPAWTPDALRAVIDSGDTRSLKLVRPMPIRTVYITAWVAAGGSIQFRPDIYRRDAAAAAKKAAAKPKLISACGPVLPPPSTGQDSDAAQPG